MDRYWTRQPLRLMRALCLPVFIVTLLASCAGVHLGSLPIPRTDYSNTYHRGCTLVRLWQVCPTVPITGLPGTLHEDVAPFHSIYIAGPYNVGLRSDRGGRNVVVQGDSSVIGRTHVYVKDGVLHVKAEDGYAYSNNNLANIDIRMGVLTKIYFDSPGQLLAKGVRATRLMVIANHRARVILKGQVRYLDVITYEQARVDTHELQVKKTISAMASGDSRLYHTNQPVNRNAYPQPNGAIIRMGGLKLEPKCPKPPCKAAVKADLFADDEGE